MTFPPPIGGGLPSKTPDPETGQSPQEREACYRAEILRFLGAIHEPGDVVELRSLETHVRGTYCATASGYYTDLEALAHDALQASPRSKGVYVTLNRVDPELLARRANKFHWVKRGEPLTGDAEVRRRRSVLVDCDPVRVSGIPSTDSEHEAALKKADEIRDALLAEGWPMPIFIDTGNGAALYFRVDLPADDAGLAPLRADPRHPGEDRARPRRSPACSGAGARDARGGAW